LIRQQQIHRILLLPMETSLNSGNWFLV